MLEAIGRSVPGIVNAPWIVNGRTYRRSRPPPRPRPGSADAAQGGRHRRGQAGVPWTSQGSPEVRPAARRTNARGSASSTRSGLAAGSGRSPSQAPPSSHWPAPRRTRSWSAPRPGPAPPRQAARDRPGGQVGQQRRGRCVGVEPPPGGLGHVAAVVPGVVEPQRPKGPDRGWSPPPRPPGPASLGVQGGQLPAPGVGGRLQPSSRPSAGSPLWAATPAAVQSSSEPSSAHAPRVLARAARSPSARWAARRTRRRPGRGGGHGGVPVGRAEAGRAGPPDPAVGGLGGLDQGGGGELRWVIPAKEGRRDPPGHGQDDQRRRRG